MKHVSRKPLLVLCVLLLISVGSDAQPAPLKGGWTARSSTGLTLKGTWTAVADPKTGAVTGTWTLDDAKGTTVTSGAVVSSKVADRMDRRVAIGSFWQQGRVPPALGAQPSSSRPTHAFVELFAIALKTIVSGTWRTGRHSGAWSIRAQ